MKRILLAAALVIALTQPAFAWFNYTEEWDLIYIADVNGFDVSASDYDTAPEVTETQKLPLTINCKFQESPTYDIPIHQAELQYSTTKDGDTWTNWQSFGVQYDNSNIDWKAMVDRNLMGQYTLTSDEVTPGDTVAVRLWFANNSANKENADKGANTTAEGSNGWQDPWVTTVPTATNTRPSHDGGIFDFVPGL